MAQNALENQNERVNWHWRNTMRPVRFFNLDARAGLPVFILILYARPITLAITIVIIGLFWFVERKGLTFPSALRALRVWIIGYDRPSWISLRHRRLKDFG